MKLIIQIPCLNEEKTLPLVFEKLPRSIPGVDIVEYQIIDDGSSDKTVEVARQLGVHHIVKIKGKNRRWLGRAFKRGVENALKQDADILVNTDGDNQYPSDRIADLIQPIIDEEVDIVIGDRGTQGIEEFSGIKRFLQKLGSGTIQFLTKEPVADAVSGFRAYSRDAMLRLNVVTNYTYTVDTLIQANKKGIDIKWLPIQTNSKTRDSRLIKNSLNKVIRSGGTIVRLTTVYEPFKVFLALALLLLVPGGLLLLRYTFLFLFIDGASSGHLQSLVAGSAMMLMGLMLAILGMIGEMLAVNRTMIDECLSKIRKLEAKFLSND